MEAKSQFRATVASSIGGGLEMYDFVIYVFFAPILASLFFPKTDPFAALLATYGIFAIGYFSRPLGAVLFGHYGDRAGRKNGLLATILLMAVATTGIACLPTYHEIGRWAPVLLVVCRILQGVAVGGDLPGAITLVSEMASVRSRGLQCAFVYCGVNVGILLASGIAALITLSLSHLQVVAYGWRIAFLVGLIIAIVGYYVRRKVAETPYFYRLMAIKARESLPFAQLISKHFFKFLMGIGMTCLFSVLIAQIYLFMPVFLEKTGMSSHEALLLNTISTAVFALLIPVMGWLSDRLKRKALLMITAFGFVVGTYIAYDLLVMNQLWEQCLALLILAILSALIVGMVPAMLSEIFKTSIRYTGVALTYNVSFAIFAGCTPMVLTSLLHRIPSMPVAMSIALMTTGVITFVSVLFFKDRTGEALED